MVGSRASLPTAPSFPCVSARGQNESNYTIISALVLIIISGFAPNFERLAAPGKSPAEWKRATRMMARAWNVKGADSRPIFASINPVRSVYVTQIHFKDYLGCEHVSES